MDSNEFYKIAKAITTNMETMSMMMDDIVELKNRVKILEEDSEVMIDDVDWRH